MPSGDVDLWDCGSLDRMTLADHAGTIALGGRTVPRLGFGTMRLTGPGIFGEPPIPRRVCAPDDTVLVSKLGGARRANGDWYAAPTRDELRAGADRECDALLDRCTELGVPFVPFFSILTTDRAQAVHDVAAQLGASPAQIAIAWQLRRAPNVLPIPGTSNPEHLTENLAAVQIELSDAQYAAIT